MLARAALARRAILRRCSASRVALAASTIDWCKPAQPPARALEKLADAVRLVALKGACAAPLVTLAPMAFASSGGGAEGIGEAMTGLAMVGAAAVAGCAALALTDEAAPDVAASLGEPLADLGSVLGTAAALAPGGLHEENSLDLDAGDMLASLERPGQPVPAQLTTDAHIVVFEDVLLDAGVMTTLRVGATAWDASWALDHHNGVVQYHSDGRKRALVLPPIERITDMVHNKLAYGRPLNGPLENATKDWLELVCVSATSSRLELKAPFDTLAVGYNYCPDGDGGRMAISPPVALLYKMNQFMSCRGLLPEFIEEAAACLFAENSLSQRQFVGMGNPLEPGTESDLLLVNYRAKDSWAELMATGLETGFKGYLVMGMCGPHYRRWAHDHGLPEAAVIDWSDLGADDFSQRDGVVRSEAFQKIFDTCLAHGVLGPGDELLLVKALHGVRDGRSDLIEALEILNVVAVGDGTFEMRGSERVSVKMKSWDADLPVAVELRNALAPTSMGVAAFLGACKFVPVPDSAQIKSRHRRVGATHWSICAQVPPGAYGDVVAVDYSGKEGYRPGRFLNPEKTALLTKANDPARGLIYCNKCDKEWKPKKSRDPATGVQRYKCSECQSCDIRMVTEPTGDYAII